MQNSSESIDAQIGEFANLLSVVVLYVKAERFQNVPARVKIVCKLSGNSFGIPLSFRAGLLGRAETY